MTRQQSLRQRNPNPKKNAGAGASTPEDLRTVVFYQRTYARIIRPALSVIPAPPAARTYNGSRPP